jgi:hypothetical protein
VYGYLACFKFPSLPEPTLQNLVSQYSNLNTHTTNIAKLFDAVTPATRKLSTKTPLHPKNETKETVQKTERKTILRFWSIAGATIGLTMLYLFGSAYRALLKKKAETRQDVSIDEYHFDDQFEGLVEEDLGQSNYRN